MVKEKQETESEIVNETDTTTVLAVDNEEKKLMNDYVFELNLCFSNYAEDLCLNVPELKQDGNKSNFDHCNFFVLYSLVDSFLYQIDYDIFPI